ncbi:MAG: hypothetical protein H6702_19830 [Myxococcales bacterium]|nr:hypothetical protein [Myxococcales bacterium]
MRGVWWTLAVLATGVACDDGGGGEPMPPGSGDGQVADGGPADAARDPDGAAPDGCAPRVCPEAACGPIEDGCGGVLDCGLCACDPARFGEDCPPRPCEIALGCEGGQCQYSPITCGGRACRCPGEACAEDAPRPCGAEACPADYCDPQPTVTDGVISYGNACIGPPERPCGLCGLGRERCDPVAGGLVCTDLTLPGLDPGEVECDSTRDGSTFLYVDADFDGGAGDGSKQAPFRALTDAIAAAAARNTRGIVVGGAPTFTAPFAVLDGVSIYGGYTRSPEFAPSPALRPRVEVDPVHVADGRLVAVDAVDIERPTLLSNFIVRTPDLRREPGVHGYGVRALRAPGLILVDVDVQVGAAGDGAAGAPGEPGRVNDAEQDGQLGRDTAPAGALCEADGQVFYCDPEWHGEVLGGEGGAGTACHDGQRAPAGGRGGSGRYTCPGPIPGELGLPAIERPGTLAGAPGRPTGAPDADGWWHSDGDGTSGQVGAHGAGGRGGFGGVRPYPMCGLGASGGGGGAGGCGGLGGEGGQGGGWAFALFMVDSPAADRARPVRRRPGGAGGASGVGGGGEPWRLRRYCPGAALTVTASNPHRARPASPAAPAAPAGMAPAVARWPCCATGAGPRCRRCLS